MKCLRPVAVALSVAAVATLGTYGGLHSFVVTSDGLRTYPGDRFSLPPVVVDLRHASVADLAGHPFLVKEILLRGDARYLPGVPSLGDAVKVLESLEESMFGLSGAPESR